MVKIILGIFIVCMITTFILFVYEIGFSFFCRMFNVDKAVSDATKECSLIVNSKVGD